MQLVEAHRFGQVRGEPGINTAFDVGLHTETAQGNRGHRVELLYLLNEITARPIGETDVGNDQIEFAFCHSAQCFLHAGCAGDVHSPMTQNPPHDTHGVGVIINEQDL